MSVWRYTVALPLVAALLRGCGGATPEPQAQPGGTAVTFTLTSPAFDQGAAKVRGVERLAIGGVEDRRIRRRQPRASC